MIKAEKFDKWINYGYNVLFIGAHGIGKTAQVKDAFNRNNLKWLYFSAATMDPWVDLIGIPKEKVLEDGTSVLELVRPQPLACDEVEAIFFDELNRAPAKVRNAVMELIQFRSINGHKFTKLKVIWAAINPDDPEKTYDVERLDPAHKDRFPIQIPLEYKPDLEYFTSVYGLEWAKHSIEWWDQLKPEVKAEVSPRRLDYALQAYKDGIDLRDVLPKASNVSKLTSILKNGLAKDVIERLWKEGNMEAIREQLKNPNVWDEVYPWMLEKEDRIANIAALGPAENIAKMLSQHLTDDKIMKPLLSSAQRIPSLYDAVTTYSNAQTDNKVRQRIANLIVPFSSLAYGSKLNEVPTWTYKMKTNPNFEKSLIEIREKNLMVTNTTTRAQALAILQDMPEDVNEDFMTLVFTLCIMYIQHSHNATLKSTMKESFGLLNHCLQKLNRDIRSNTAFKNFCNRMISKELEGYIWIPSQK